MKRLLSIALCFMLLATTAYISAFAEEDDSGFGNNYGNVEDTLDEGLVITSSVYNISYGVIYGILPGSTAGEVLSNVDLSDQIKAFGSNDIELENSTVVSTGDTIKLYKDDSMVDQLTVCVSGDVNCDGIVTVSDIVLGIDGILGTNLSAAQNKAADLNSDKLITVTDMINIRKMIFAINTLKYDSELYNAPIWSGNVTYQENAAIISYDGVIKDIGLLYKPNSIIAVRSYDLKTLYEYGKDYTLTNEGKISIPAGSSIKSLPYERFIALGNGSWLDSADGTKSVVQWGKDIHTYQISVTYTHSDAWSGYIPESQASHISKLYNKLESGSEINAIIYGDSISAGWNASGLNEAHTMNYNGGNIIERTDSNPEKLFIAPYAPTWSRAVIGEMQKKYPDAQINYYNNSCSSSNSSNYGLPFVETKVNDYEPDVVFLGFGTNEAGISKDNFKSNTMQIINKIVAKYPDCAIVMVSAEVPNLVVKGYSTNNLHEFEDAYYEIQAENPNMQLAVAPVNSVSQYVNSKKIFQDITGNNINHPNDFGVRVYISTLMQAMGLY